MLNCAIPPRQHPRHPAHVRCAHREASCSPAGISPKPACERGRSFFRMDPRRGPRRGTVRTVVVDPVSAAALIQAWSAVQTEALVASIRHSGALQRYVRGPRR
jgi:hypothetical protein